MAAIWHVLWPGWSQVWPNVLASILWSVPALLWHHWRLVKVLRRHHVEVCRAVESVPAVPCSCATAER